MSLVFLDTCAFDDPITSIPMCVISGKLEVRIVGCQDIMENVPGRSRNASVHLPSGTAEAKATFLRGASKSFHGKQSVNKYNLKPDDMSSKSNRVLMVISLSRVVFQ